MSSRSGYRLRDATASKVPARYREYDMSNAEAEHSERRTRAGRGRPSATSQILAQRVPKLEPLPHHSGYTTPTPTATRVYTSAVRNIGGSLDAEHLQYDEADQDIATNDELSLLGEETSYTPHQFSVPHSADLSFSLKTNLRQLKNILKLPKARTFVFCEFFYSAVDRQIFLEENEFAQLVQESFPNLKTTKLRLPEWREVRRLIGKPRRFSQCFLDEERRSLAFKRRKIRQIYNGSCLTLSPDFDLPKKLPRQPVLGLKVYARIREPRDGIYAGAIDAILSDGYRVTFEKEEVLSAQVVPDTEVMCETQPELLSISYFIEMNNASNRTGPFPNSLLPKPTFVIDPRQNNKVVPVAHTPNQTPTFSFQQRPTGARDDRVGNFPLRMLVIMVKLFKVLDHKGILLHNLTWMNDSAEKMAMVSNSYAPIFQERYAELLRELEMTNRLLESYMNGIEEYNDLLVANLAEPRPADRPEQLRRSSLAHSTQIVKHCNQALDVKSRSGLQLIAKLMAMLLQVRQLGIERKHYINFEMSILAETLNQIKCDLSPGNIAAFQDCVEIHMKQLFLMSRNRM